MTDKEQTNSYYYRIKILEAELEHHKTNKEAWMKKAIFTGNQLEEAELELKFVYSQIRKHDHTGVLKALFKDRIETKKVKNGLD